MTQTFKDLAGSLVTSSYKWLTSTLLTAQQQFAVRPYISAKVIDDTIQPNATLFSGSGSPLSRGSMVLAPDGSMLAAGFDVSNHVVFLQAPDLNASGGTWPTSVTLDTQANLNPTINQVAISCSDWIGGTYHIDVFYFANFAGDGTQLKVYHQYSQDGGVSWSTNFVNLVSMPNTNYPGKNLSIAALQTRSIAGVVNSGFVYLVPNFNTFSSGFVGYDINYAWGDMSITPGSLIPWGPADVNSNDWTLHSLTAFYLNGIQYVAFSGLRNILATTGSFQNFSIWVTAILNIQKATASDLWSPPVPLMPIGSTNSLNQNQFINPMASVQNGMATVAFEAVLVDSVSQTAQGSTSSVVSTHTNYMMVQSDDGKTFSYPSVLVSTNGTEFNSGSSAVMIQQGNYWYLGAGAGWLWQFVQNAIVADITTDVIGYTISEQAGQPSTISLKLANANNKWVGASPTGQGAAAIARNRKIVIYQGYYNSVGVPEVVPRNIYYIDDIQQQVSGTQNDVLLVGRDLYKKLKTTTTKFNYQFVGPIFYTDIFDGTTNNNWNQIAGTWTFGTSPNSVDGLNIGSEATMMLSNTSFSTFGHTMRVFFQNTATGTVIIYGMYVDSSNWLRLEINTATGAWAVKKNVNGSTTSLDNGTLPTAMTSTDFYMVLVKRYSYWKFNFYFSRGVGTGNELSVYDPSTQSLVLKNSGTGEYDISSDVASTTSMQSAFSVGMGASASVTQRFRYFQLCSYNNSNNVGELSRVFARLASIFSFKLVYTFRELMYTATQFVNTFSITNRILTLPASVGFVMSSTNQMGNGEISFRAKITPTVLGTDSSFGFFFRANSTGAPTASYILRVKRQGGAATTSPVVCRFERVFSGVNYRFYNSSEDVNYNAQYTSTPQLNIDPTVWHDYRVVMVDGQMFAFVDNVMVAAWNDDNVTAAFLTSGYWGFEVDGNTKLQIKSITAPILWKPLPSVSYNPGDDIESTMTALARSLLFWFYSDLWGRFKTIFLNSSDPSTYTYNSQLFQQNVDQSDKEYISQVTVYGFGVVATARNTGLMAGVPVRDIVVVDYTILTQADAQTRANNVLINANQFLNQNSSKQIINVGSELFDVVTVVNTGNNTSGVDSATRVYDQNIDQGGGNNNTEYFLEIDTGNV